MCSPSVTVFAQQQSDSLYFFPAVGVALSEYAKIDYRPMINA
jgi:hypothetical protein